RGTNDVLPIRRDRNLTIDVFVVALSAGCQSGHSSGTKRLRPSVKFVESEYTSSDNKQAEHHSYKCDCLAESRECCCTVGERLGGSDVSCRRPHGVIYRWRALRNIWRRR